MRAWLFPFTQKNSSSRVLGCQWISCPHHPRNRRSSNFKWRPLVCHSRVRVIADPAGRSLLLKRGISVGADFGTPRGSLSALQITSYMPSTGTYGYHGCDGGWTEGAFVFLSTVAGLAYSFYTPYVQCLTEGPQPRRVQLCEQGLRSCSPWFGAEVDGVGVGGESGGRGAANRCRAVGVMSTKAWLP